MKRAVKHTETAIKSGQTDGRTDRKRGGGGFIGLDLVLGETKASAGVS